LLFGPKEYNVRAIMEASKQQFINQDRKIIKGGGGVGQSNNKAAASRPIAGNTQKEAAGTLPTRLPNNDETITSATSNTTLGRAIPKREVAAVKEQANTVGIKNTNTSIATTETALVDKKKKQEEKAPPPAKQPLAKNKEEETKSAVNTKPAAIATTSPKNPPPPPQEVKHHLQLNIQTARATATKRKERPVESKSPMATREDWQRVMREQPLYPPSTIEISPSHPLNVGLITANGIKGPTQHVFVDGIEGSEYLHLQVLCDAKQHNCTSALDYPNVDIWMVDANSAKDRPFPNDIVHQIVAIDQPKFRIFFVDYSDRLVLRKGFMDSIYFDIDEDRLLEKHIRYGLRCIDKYRRWVGAKQYVNSGRVVHPMWDEMLITKGGPPLHAPFAVRTDIANAIHRLLPSIAQKGGGGGLLTKNTTTADAASCSSPWPYHPVDCIPDRPMDLIHLWKVIETVNGLLRNLATQTVEKMRTWKHPSVNNRTLRVETAIQGNRAHTGRQSVSDDYVRTLLQTKIVIVTQRDGWEDHFRLFEALAAGTMVLMDEMVSLPHGLEDGESVVFFHSIQEMQDKALYYLEHTEERLAIARKGWEVTMEKHRSWHRLEEMLFGKALTKPTLNESWYFDT